MRKRIAIGVALVVVIGVVYVAARPRKHSGEWVEGSGVMEAREVDVSALVGGQLREVLVREGERVREGEVVAEIGREELEAQAGQARGAVRAAEGELARAEAAAEGARLAAANARAGYEKGTELKGRYEAAEAQHRAAVAAYEQASARLDLLRRGTREEQLEQARAGVASAEAGARDARRELARLERLEAEGGVSRQAVDRQRTAVEAAEAGLEGARARLAEAEAGAREEELRQAEAALQQAEWNVETAARNLATARELYEDRLLLKQQLDAAEAGERGAREALEAAGGQAEAALGGLAVAEKRLGDATVRAPMDGVVVLKVREAGESVAPGQPIVRLADLEHMWMRVYVPETELDRVKLGQEVEVRIDASPGKAYRGRVAEIGQEAEFTPKNVQTREQRVKLVFPVKVEVENPREELKPGMPAEARIMAGGRGRDG